jgi:hypothetical protein
MTGGGEMDNGALRYNSGKVKLSYLPLEIVEHSIKFEKLLDGYWEVKKAFNFLQWADAHIKSKEYCPDALSIFTDCDLWPKICAVLENGAKKYARDNWKKGLAFDEIIDSALRHFEKIIIAESVEALDTESGLPHIDHIWCNLMFIGYQLYIININRN